MRKGREEKAALVDPRYDLSGRRDNKTRYPDEFLAVYTLPREGYNDMGGKHITAQVRTHRQRKDSKNFQTKDKGREGEESSLHLLPLFCIHSFIRLCACAFTTQSGQTNKQTNREEGGGCDQDFKHDPTTGAGGDDVDEEGPVGLARLWAI